MGIPKFFRYISQRWPEISQLIEGDQIPEYDNLYLDMNSILHNCTRSEDINIKMTQEEVFAKIFAYIDHLFNIIKPKNTFYMAIDGVAPRAKMNQQRARRFRSAKDAEQALNDAIEKGEYIPNANGDDEDNFDKNAITPGTEFMARLTKNLKYYIHDKVSKDSAWASINVIFSGHEVPGEGEHKIMDYIRTLRSAKDYNPNTRHCIYGLDADLIILGLVTHEPHLSILREEVKFGKEANAASKLPLERQTFFLLHISLVREYLELEFKHLVDELPFKFDFERVIDDFIFALYVIGNDFLPNLPGLHLNKGAFSYILQTFKESLKHMDDYITEKGQINLKRFAIWLDFLSRFEYITYEKQNIDLDWFNSNLDKISLESERKREKLGKSLLLKQEKKTIGAMKKWILKIAQTPIDSEFINNNPTFSLNEHGIYVTDDNLEFMKKFVHELGFNLVHKSSTDEYSLKYFISEELQAKGGETQEESHERAKYTRSVLKNYEHSVLIEDKQTLEETKHVYDEKFDSWKNQYYLEKVEFGSIAQPEKLVEMCENYIEGLQWVLYYYYRGCPAWGWYYKYHYAPRVSDLKKGLQLKIEFEAGKPFLPFQQLMAVLPERSKKLLPAVYRPLMYEDNSPIKDFYPDSVEYDMNGKTADWEAVVKISFVDAKRLIDAMAPLESKLNPEEKQRNKFGTDLIFIYNPQVDEIYQTPLAGMFKDIEHNHCVEKHFTLQTVSWENLKFGLLRGASMGAFSMGGFPSLKYLVFEDSLEFNETRVFQFPSKDQSVVLKVADISCNDNLTIEDFAKRYLNTVVFTRWPYVRESKVISISDGSATYSRDGNTIKKDELDHKAKQDFHQSASRMLKDYAKTKGVIMDKITYLLTVQPVAGIERNASGAFVKVFHDKVESYPLQLVVDNVSNHDMRFAERDPVPIDQEFPVGSKCIFLGDYAYGAEATVLDYSSPTRLKLEVTKKLDGGEPPIGHKAYQKDKDMIKYVPAYVAAKKLFVTSLFFSKITSDFRLKYNNRFVNVGLSLKFESKQHKVLGYAKRFPKGWSYSNLAIKLVEQYRATFPQLFERLSVLGNEIATFEAIFSDFSDSQTKELVSSVKKWLSDVKADFVTVQNESDALSKSAISQIEDYAIKHVATEKLNTETKKLSKVPTDAILVPQQSYSQLSKQKFNLGDRVVYIQSNGKVPIFSKGTVIGYFAEGQKMRIQVLFDEELVAGSRMDGRLKTFRAIGLDSSLLLNVSDRQFIYHSKASKDYEPVSVDEKTKKQQMQKKVQLLKKKQAHELLSYIKKDTEENDLANEKDKGEAPLTAKNIALPVNKATANKIFDSIYKEYTVAEEPQDGQYAVPYTGPQQIAMPPGMNGQPPMMMMMPPQAPHGFMPPPPPMIGPNGLPIPMQPPFHANGVSGVPPVMPVSSQQQHFSEAGEHRAKEGVPKIATTENQKAPHKNGQGPARGGHRGRGGNRGGNRGGSRGGNRGGNRGGKNRFEKPKNTKEETA